MREWLVDEERWPDTRARKEVSRAESDGQQGRVELAVAQRRRFERQEPAGRTHTYALERLCGLERPKHASRHASQVV